MGALSRLLRGIAVVVVVGCGGESTTTSGGAGNGGATSTGAGGSGASATSSGGATTDGGATSSGGATTDGGATSSGGADPSSSSSGGGGAGSSAGCGVAQRGGVTTESIQAAGLDRSYVRVVPDGYEPRAPIPVVFIWHGNNWTGTSLRAETLPLESAFGEPALFVYANGLTVTDLPVEAAGGVMGTGWDWRPGERDVALFDAILSELEQQFCIDTSRVLSFGRSHGAFFANALACARGDVLKKTAVVSGGFPGTVVGDACAASSMPIWIAHNSGDSVVNVSFAQQARDHWVARNGCDNTTTNVPPAPCGAFEGCASAGVTYCEATANSHDPPPFALEAAGIFLASP